MTTWRSFMGASVHHTVDGVNDAIPTYSAITTRGPDSRSGRTSQSRKRSKNAQITSVALIWKVVKPVTELISWLNLLPGHA